MEVEEVELIAKTRCTVDDTNLRIGLDAHGVCWIVGFDIAQVLGRRFLHIPQVLKGVTADGQILARFEVLGHWLRANRHERTDLLTIGTSVLNIGVPTMCTRLYGARVVPTPDEPALVNKVLKGLAGDRHVYSSLVRQAFGAPSIQRDQGPFAPHHTLVGSMFELTAKGEVLVLPLGQKAMCTLLGITTEEAAQ